MGKLTRHERLQGRRSSAQHLPEGCMRRKHTIECQLSLSSLCRHVSHDTSKPAREKMGWGHEGGVYL